MQEGIRMWGPANICLSAKHNNPLPHEGNNALGGIGRSYLLAPLGNTRYAGRTAMLNCSSDMGDTCSQPQSASPCGPGLAWLGMAAGGNTAAWCLTHACK